MQFLLYGIVALAILGAVSGIAYKVRQSGYDAAMLECKAAAEEIRKAEQAKIQVAGVKKERSDAKARVVYRTLREQVDRVVDRVEYVNLPCLAPDELRIANDAIRGATGTPAGEPDGTLRAPAAAGGRDQPDSPAVDR